MATEVQVLTSPENGWNRYDDDDTKLIWSPIRSEWSPLSGDYRFYKGTETQKSGSGIYIEFKFYGTGFRIIASIHQDKSALINVNLNGEDVDTFSENGPVSYNQAKVYEKINLVEGVYIVRLTNKDSGAFMLDAIDLRGNLIHPILNEVNSVIDIKKIGDAIPCRYTALTSGQVGAFSELGTTTATQISAISSATPNGSFYWIYVGKDYLGRKKFIADRNIQHSISWDTLNSVDIGVGEGLSYNKYYKDVTPALTSSTTPTPYVASSTLSKNDANAYKVFSTVNSDFISSSASMNESIKLDYGVGNEKAINKYSYMAYTSNGGSASKALKSWTFFGSNNGIDWITLDVQSNQTLWVSGETRTFSFNNTTKYRYYKFGDGSNNGDTVNYQSCIAKLKYYELNNFIDNKFGCSIRLLTGGVSSTDKDNEWDQIIVNSTLNNTITAGDNNIWNCKNIYSWVSTTPSVSANRALRGYTSVDTFYSGGFYANTGNTVTGFRPVLLIEEYDFSPIIKNPVKTILDNGLKLNISVDKISSIEESPVKVKIYVTKPNKTIVIKRDYDTEFQPTPFIMDNTTFDSTDFDLGINKITIEAIDNNSYVRLYEVDVIKTNVNKLLLLDGNKLKDTKLELLDPNYYSVESSNLEQLFITKGSTDSIKFNDNFKLQVESKYDLKLLVLNIDLLK